MASRSRARTAPSADKHAYHIESLARGLAVLDAFSSSRPELTLGEIAEAAAVTQPSALRIGYTLIEAGYLIRNPITKGYRLGPRAVSVGLATLGSMTLPDIAQPYLVGLRNQTRESVKLAVPAGMHAVIVARLASLDYPDAFSYIGSRSELPVSSLGRAMLAFASPEQISAVLDHAQLVKLTPKTLPRSRVRAELRRVREAGYACNDQGTTMENRAVAAPLLAADGTPVGAVNVSASAQRYTMSQLVDAVSEAVVGAARAISAMLPPHVQGAGKISA